MDSADLFKRKYSVLQNISKALVEIHDIRSISNVMLDLAISYTSASAGSLMLLNDRNQLYILTARGLDPQFVKEYCSPLGEGIAGSVAQSRLPVLVEDIESDPRFRELRRDHYRTRSFISCPLVNKKKLFGVLNVNDKKDGAPFTAEEFDLLQSISNHVALALENVFLLNELQSKAAELEKTNKRLTDTYLLKNEFLGRISHELRTPLNAVKGAIYYLRQGEGIDGGERSEFHDIIATETDKLVGLIDNMLRFLQIEDESKLIDRTILRLSDILRKLTETRSLRTLLLKQGVELDVTLPDALSDIIGDKFRITQLFVNLIEGLCHFLESGDRIHVGVIEQDRLTVTVTVPKKLPKTITPTPGKLMNVFRTEQNDYRLKLYLAWSIADVHRWAISAEHEASSTRVVLSIPKSSNERVDTLVNISMDSFAQFIADRLNVDICSIMLSDLHTNELTVRASRGLDDDVVRRTSIKIGDKIAGWVALEGKPLFIENIESDPRFAKKSTPQYTTKSLMSFPLMVGERVVGVLNLNNKKDQDSFSLRDYAVAETIGDQISKFLERLYTGTYHESDVQELMTSLEKILPRPSHRSSPDASEQNPA
ncbi:MAG: GAF domain-containing protein [Nitrospiraceae bacterium]|nr:GAF domain-containing protein [Nitrospiraceae bacterium]